MYSPSSSGGGGGEPPASPTRIGFMEVFRRRFQGKDIGRQFWMPDSISKQCYECSTRFTTIRRRHHCRICGQIFCSNCCNEMVNAKLFNTDGASSATGFLRVCRYCHNFVTNHKLNHHEEESTDNGIVATQTNLSQGSKSPGNNNTWLFKNMMTRGLSSPLRVMVRSARASDRNKPVEVSNVDALQSSNVSLRPASAASNSERRMSYIENLCDTEASPSILSSSLDNFRHMMAQLDESIDVSEPIWVKEILEQSAKLKLNHSDWEGSSLSDLLDSTKEEKLEEVKRRISHGSESESEELLEDLTDSDKKKIKMYNFRENLSDTIVRYSPSPAVQREKNEAEVNNNLDKLYDIYEDLMIDSKTFFEPKDEAPEEPPVDHSDMPLYLCDVIYDLHCNRILNQILLDERLSLDWLPIIADLAKRIANTITLSQYAYLYSIDSFYQSYSDDAPNGTQSQQQQQQYPMDIRRRVKIKSIQNGSKTECSVINGLVFNKNVAHKQMRTSIDEPRILLFACSIGYDERRRSVATTTSTVAILKMTMFDSMRMQESSYISNLVAKIASLQPDVIFVQGSVSQMALEQLREKQITVVLNVKKSILERIALFTGTFMIQSPEMIMSTTKIGRCARFRLQAFQVSAKDNEAISGHKTLMFLEGCPETIGCSVLLRGSSSYAEFKKLKDILRYLIYVQYHCRLEKAFHLSFNCIPLQSDGPWKSMGELYQHLRQQLQGKKTRSRHPTGNDDLASSPRSVVEIDLNSEKLTKLTIIDDNSDPLRAPIEDQDQEELKNKESDLSKAARVMSEKLEQLVAKVPLSCSPAIDFPVPFLHSKNIEKRSSLRFYYPTDLLDSPRLKREMLKKEVEKNSYEEVFDEPDSEGKDDDYVNFKYLLAQAKEGRPEDGKLAALRQLLINRYMVTKEHPLFNNCDYDFRRQHQQYIADFRAVGPAIRYVPEFFPRHVEDKKKGGSESSESSTKKISDPLRTEEQQEISVLFSVFSSLSENAPKYCFKPKIIDIMYYGRNDMSLGAFLFRHFFFFRRSRFNQAAGSDETLDPSGTTTNAVSLELSRKIICFNENCNVSMFKHIMRFTHHNGTILVLLNKLHDTRHVEMPHKIMTWTYCTQCHQRSNYTDVSSDALAMSFGKFLELKFYGKRHFNCYKYFPEADIKGDENCLLCQHSMHENSFQFFSYDQLVVSFKFEPIRIYEVATPAPIIPVTKNFFSKLKLIDELRELTVHSEEVFTQIIHEIDKVKNGLPTNSGLNITLDQSDLVLLDEFLQMLQQEKIEFAQKIKEVHYRISQPKLEESSAVELFRIQNSVVRVKKLVAETVSGWNVRINEYISSRKGKSEKLFTSLVNRFLSNETNQQEKESASLDSDGGSIRRNDASSSTLDNVSDNTVIDEESEPPPSEPDKATGSKLISKVISKVTNNDGAASNFASLFMAKGNEENHVNIEMPQFESSAASKANQMFEHFKLPIHKDIGIIVRDRDPGSIIAYALTSPEYDKKLSMIRAEKQNLSSTVDGAEVDGKAVGEGKPSSATNTTPNKTETSDATKKTSPSQHIDVQFNDPCAKFYCCIYFAEQFRRFRSLVVTDGDLSNRDTIRATNSISAPSKSSVGEDLFIHSLSSCIPWNALGGKSGSTFSKTQNERFILKEVSKGELRHFLTFVCDYISYCERACLDKRPSVLVKVVGVYQISYKNTVTNKGSIHYILVMENLFYECNVSVIYDLKGSMRNRKVDITMMNAQGVEEEEESPNGQNSVKQRQMSGQPESPTSKKVWQAKPVLLDENLRQVSALSPLYTQVHAKIFLMEAIYRDSTFLKIHGVMDYSLLVGYDEENCEYVVGIIDYIRLFNWEKVLEFRVKKIGNAIDPTIVHPMAYQKRFLEAISEYFIEVPDKWHRHLKLVPVAGNLRRDSCSEPDDSATGSDQSSPYKGKINSTTSEPVTDKDDQVFV